MKILQKISMVTVAAVVLNVWLFRFGKATIYRGGDATNMTEEFAAYGLSEESTSEQSEHQRSGGILDRIELNTPKSC